MKSFTYALLLLLFYGSLFYAARAQSSIAKQWNEALLDAIRNDLARPPVHARNLFHVSAAMWDAWAAYDNDAQQWLHEEKRVVSSSIPTDRQETISYAAYRILIHRFANSRGFGFIELDLNRLMRRLGYNVAVNTTVGDTPAALGNRIAASYIEFGLQDGSNEVEDYKSRNYFTVNPRLMPTRRGNPGIWDPNRWQSLWLATFVDQSGNTIDTGVPAFQSPEWGRVTPFSLQEADRKIYRRDDYDFWVYHDPGPPPLLYSEDEDLYKSGFEQVVLWSGLLDPTVGEIIDISPASRGNNALGTNNGTGYPVNPYTQQPYEPQMVPAGDYYRVLAEFWADGPDSETPPGHWFTIANKVSYHEQFVRRIEGQGEVLSPLEWDVKLYLALGGALHDAAIAAWSTKGWYDYVRPISAIRYMAGKGQCTDPNMPSYDPDGINLYPGYIELITPETVRPGARHAHLNETSVGRIAVKAWRGPSYIDDPTTDMAGVGWILAEDWWPYQRPSFVTPPFAGYVSGHSTFSRAAARVMTDLTGSPFFPGGMGEFEAPQNDFLVFEKGPSINLTLQWAKYFDASDECSLSRIYGGIHPTADDIPGRIMGDTVGKEATQAALSYFAPRQVKTHSWSKGEVYIYLGEDNPWSSMMFSTAEQVSGETYDAKSSTIRLWIVASLAHFMYSLWHGR